MGGLQSGVVSRSKNVEGVAVLSLRTSLSRKELFKLELLLERYSATFSKELEIELLLKKDGRVLPAIVHGVDASYIPPFLEQKKISNFIVPYDFAYRLDLEEGESFSLISPAETIHSLAGIPRMSKGVVEKFFTTGVPEFDQINIWTRLHFLQNFLHIKHINKMRIYTCSNLEGLLKNISSQFPKSVMVQRWEDINRDLAWALKLESKMMLGLFLSVIFLVSISIISGQLLFWNKIKQDLVGMWLLGASSRQLFRAAFSSFFLLNLLATVMGLILSYGSLKLFALYGGNILPDIFIDRKIPVLIEPYSLLISFVLPTLIATFFCWYTLKILMKDTDFLELIRTP